jgi:hypothetical protein
MSAKRDPNWAPGWQTCGRGVLLLTLLAGSACGDDAGKEVDDAGIRGDGDDQRGDGDDSRDEDASTDEVEDASAEGDAGNSIDASTDEPDAGEEPGDGGLPVLSCDGPGSRFATGIYDYAWGPGQSFGQHKPDMMLGPPKGGGACEGSLDVVSLGNGGFVILEFADNAIVDGPGPDFLVFENGFGVSSPSKACDHENPYAELATVSVSEDGVTWVDFPCTASEAPAGTCAGWHVVYANADKNDIDATDPEVAGGDAFDLHDIGVERARLVRITDRVDLVGGNGVFDLDAVAIVNAECN